MSSINLFGVLLFLLIVLDQIQARELNFTAPEDVLDMARQFSDWFSQDLADTFNSATHDHLKNNTISIDDSYHQLYNRGQRPPPSSDDAFDDAAAKGCNLLYMMSASAEDALARMQLNPKLSTWQKSQSVWTNTEALGETGWSVRETESPSLAWMGIDDVMDSLGIDGTSEDNVDVLLYQGQDFKYKGTEYEASEGDYQQVVNAQAGLVIAYNIYSPRYKAEHADPPVTGPITPLHQYSDVLFLQYSELCDEDHADIKGLKHFLFLKIENWNTWAMINKVLLDKTGSLDVPDWPGMTVSMNDKAGKALLSTQIGTPLAWLLIQHKVQFGMKTVLKVQIFRNKGEVNEDTDRPYPNLLFTIIDVESPSEDHCEPTDACCCPILGTQSAPVADA